MASCLNTQAALNPEQPTTTHPTSLKLQPRRGLQSTPDEDFYVQAGAGSGVLGVVRAKCFGFRFFWDFRD